jgi:predicted thioesterase
MLALRSLFQSSARSLPKTQVDLRQLISVGDSSFIKKRIAKLQTVNRTALPGDEVLSTARMMDQIERLTAGMIEANLDPEHRSAGYSIDVSHEKPAYLGMECTFKTEVIEVTETKARFKVEVVNSLTGDVIGSGVHSRVILYCGDEMKSLS